MTKVALRASRFATPQPMQSISDISTGGSPMCSTTTTSKSTKPQNAVVPVNHWRDCTGQRFAVFVTSASTAAPVRGYRRFLKLRGQRCDRVARSGQRGFDTRRSQSRSSYRLGHTRVDRLGNGCRQALHLGTEIRPGSPHRSPGAPRQSKCTVTDGVAARLRLGTGDATGRRVGLTRQLERPGCSATSNRACKAQGPSASLRADPWRTRGALCRSPHLPTSRRLPTERTSSTRSCF